MPTGAGVAYSERCPEILSGQRQLRRDIHLVRQKDSVKNSALPARNQLLYSKSNKRKVCMFDVVIMGSGMVGTMLGAILARQGAQVLIVDSGRHPRFAIGESTLRETTMMMKIMAERFDVPELVHPSSYVGVWDNIGKGSGMKRHLSYAYHREGERANPDEVYQVVIPETFDGPEIHYFRQEVDQYLAQVAVKYGATLLEDTHVTDIDISEEKGVTLTTAKGDRFEAKFIVDSTGFRSVLSEKYGLRENPCRFETKSRSIFTHMKNVKRYEDCGPVEDHDIPYRWSQGTLHHCFDGGWLWVIPFDNGPAPKNPLVSVGLQFDIRKHPNQNIPPEEEFRALISRFPSIAEQFEDAVTVRNWVSTGDRMQWSSKRTIGPRFCLTAHAAGSVGPLTSRGLILATRTLYPLAEILLKCIEDGDFSESRFQLIEDLHQVTLDNTDPD
jgi:tetracycline 7-halogenase / FADH2 O2-dependent halogenase